MAVTLTEQLECIRREIGQRKRVYPRLIAKGSMTQALADRELARMQAVEATLLPLAEKERLL